jgi:uncharacterized protein with HEPN domain
MPKRDDIVLLQDILDAIHQIESYLKRVSYRRFLNRRLLQDGVQHQLEIIGEAARNLSEDFRNQHPEVPWQDIIGMRNRITHAYFAVDLRVVWDTAKADLPDLKAWVERVLAGEGF